MFLHRKFLFHSLPRMCKQYFYQGILYPSVLPLHKTIWLRIVCWSYALLYTSKVVQTITRAINKSSTLIIYLDFEAAKTS